MSDIFASLQDKFHAFSDDQRQERLHQCMEIQLALDECKRVYNLQHKNSAKGDSSNTNRNKGDTNTSSSSSDTKNSNKKWTTSLWSGGINDRSTQKEPQEEESNEPKIKLEDTRAGMKISRFYEWGLVNPRAQAAIEAMREEGGTWNSLRPSPNSNSAVIGNSGSTFPTNSDFALESPDSFDLIDSQSSSTSLSLSTSSSTCCPRETHALWACRAMALGCATDLVKLKKCFKTTLGDTNPSSIQYNASVQSDESCGIEQRAVGDCVLKNWNELNERIERRKKQ